MVIIQKIYCCLAIDLKAEYFSVRGKHQILRGVQLELGIRYNYGKLGGNFSKSCFNRSSGGKVELKMEGVLEMKV